MFTDYLRDTRFYKKNELFSERADKYLAKKYIKDNFNDIINISPMLYVGDNCPNLQQFHKNKNIVIKPNNATGKYNIIHFNKKNNLNQIQTKCNNWLCNNLSFNCTYIEEFYKDIKPKIIIEKFINIKEEYKFHTIYGKVCFIEHILTDLKKCKWYTIDWNILNIKCLDESYKETFPKNILLGSYINKVEQILKKDNFDYVRFDTYVDRSNKLYFGEFTFTPGALLKSYKPIEFDNLLSDFLKNKKINYQLINNFTKHNNRKKKLIEPNPDNDIFEKYI